MCITNVPCYSLTCWLKRRDSHQYLNGLFFKGSVKPFRSACEMVRKCLAEHISCVTICWFCFQNQQFELHLNFASCVEVRKSAIWMSLKLSSVFIVFIILFYCLPHSFFSLFVHTSRKAQHIVGLPGKTVKTANVWSDSIIVSLLQGMSRRMQGCNVVLNQLKWTNGQEVCLSNPCATGG